MTLKGNLRDFPVVRLLNLVDLASKTGTLTLDHDRERAELSFKEGALVHAAVDHLDGQLIPALRQKGAITPEQAEAIEDHARGKTDRELALLLMRAGHVSREEAVEAMRVRVLETVYSLLAWRDGTFQFESEEPLVAGVITVHINLEDVIIKGTRRLEKMEHLRAELPDLQVALRLVDRPEFSLREVNLSEQAWRVISLINPDVTIRQIAERHQLSDFQIRTIVHELLEGGLVEIVEPEPEEERPEIVAGADSEESDGDVGPSVVGRLLRRLRGK